MKKDKWFKWPSPWMYFTTRSDVYLALSIQKGPIGYIVVAIEAPVSPAGAPPLKTIDAFFDNHAHKVVGSKATVVEAKALAGRYMKKWRKTTAASPRCECSEIGAAP